MATVQVNMHEAKTQLSKLVERAVAGDHVYIAKNGKLMVRLEPITPGLKPRKLGTGKEHIFSVPGPNEPEDPEIIAMFYGEDEGDGQRGR